MPTNHQQRECDERLLRGYLEGMLSEEEQLIVENHLCQCQRCRNLIDDSAAEEEWWSDACEYLRGDRWDEGLDKAAFSSGVNAADGSGDKSLLAVRQSEQWLDPTDDPRMLGRFGGYEILGIIGSGGMGVVMKGFEPSLNRYVAVKVLSPLLATNGAARKRFAREAQAAAAVLHENIIPIYRVDESRDLPYLVMPYVSDVPLQRRIDDEGPLPLAAILRIAEQIAAGLAAAHAHGLVHRDIKPANILLEGGVERVRITDFGLARAADDCSLTRTGVITGTPQYMSPEQARGDSIDGRSDLFSLGSVMYAMCTGRPPFRAETPYGILRRITDTEPRPIREINAEIPQWLETIVTKLHAKSIEDRFASADEVAELLKQCLAHVQQPTAVPLPQQCSAEQTLRQAATSAAWRRLMAHPCARLTPLLLAAALVIGGLTVGRGLLPKHSEQPQPTAQDTAATVTATPDVSSSDDEPAIAWDATADEIEQLLQDARPFELRVHQLWPTQSTDPIVASDSELPITSKQESKP